MNDYSYGVKLTQDLIKCRSVTPDEGGALALLQDRLSALGFRCIRLPFGEGKERIDNLYATIGEGYPHISFAGHTDVVPAGDEGAWDYPPFAGKIAEGAIWGRGAADMKGGIAAFIDAVRRFLEHDPQMGKISLIITGDEEGVAKNGTDKMVEWLIETDQAPDICIVGEPTNPDKIGDAIKNGRRGSLSCCLKIFGIGGHVAYPHLANNPMLALWAMLTPVNSTQLDEGNDHFDPSTAEITAINTENDAVNVIAGHVSARFNIRFNTEHSADSLQNWLTAHFDKISAEYKVTYEADFQSNAAPFVTKPGPLTNYLSSAIQRKTGKMPELSTAGGTSDARFLCRLCPVAEFGLVGKTMHKINEHVAIKDIDLLSDIYLDCLKEIFSQRNIKDEAR